MRYALGLGLLLLSLLQNFSTAPWPSAHSEFFAFLAVLVFGSRAFCRCNARINLSVPAILLLALGLTVTLQYIFKQTYFGGDTVVYLLYIQLALAAVWIGQLNARDSNWTQTLAVALLLAATGSALIAIAQSLWVWPDTGWIQPAIGYRRPGANLGQPNQLATLLLIGFASLIYLQQKILLSRTLCLLIGLPLLISMGVSESRAGLLSATALVIWWYLHTSTLTRTAKRQWIVAGLGALFFSMWALPKLIAAFHEPVLSAASPELRIDPSLRPVVWQQLWEAVAMKPWLGWGFRGTSLALDAVLIAHPKSEPYTYAHNLFLELAVGFGLPFAIVVSVLIGVWAWSRLSCVQSPEAWFAVALLTPIAIQSMLEYPLAYAYFLAPAMLAIGMLERPCSPTLNLRIPVRYVASSLLVFGATLIWVTIEYVEAEIDFATARFEVLNVGQTPSDYERPRLLALTQLGGLLEATRTVPQPNMSQKQLLQLKAVAKRFPWLSLQYTYAASVALNGDLLESKRQLNVLKAMHGERSYQQVRQKWETLAKEKYPQLSKVNLD